MTDPLHKPKTCKHCGRPIFWARTARGRARPIDAEPHPEGSVRLFDHKGTIVVVHRRLRDDLPPGVPLRRPHRETCPKLAEWGKRGRP